MANIRFITILSANTTFFCTNKPAPFYARNLLNNQSAYNFALDNAHTSWKETTLK